jgi:DNA-binding transcriptional ArsR family regulator
MKYTLFTKPDLFTESYVFLGMLFNGESMNDRLNEALEKYGEAHADEVRGYYAETVQLEEYVRGNLRIDDREKAEFLLKKREAVDSDHASVFYIHRVLADKPNHSKLASIMAYADEEMLNKMTKAGSIPLAYNDGELFALIDSLTGDAAFKYDLMQIYYCFDEFNDCFNALVAQVTRLFSDKLYLFEDKLKRYAGDMNEVLQADKLKAFWDRFGVELDIDKTDAEFEIRPGIYAVNTMQIRSYDEPKYDCYYMQVGVSVLALTELAEKLRPPAVLLPDFLKAMSDNTKWTIMQKLKKESMYSGQIAEQLNLTGATISHHMDTLKRLELIIYRKEGTKLFSSINEETVRMYLDGLQKALLES